jgi:hypothetical protein
MSIFKGWTADPETTRLRMPPTGVHSAAPARPRVAAPRPRPDRQRAVWGLFMDVVDEYLKEEGAK